jgi:putative peptidoglycan lipid II flippase
LILLGKPLVSLIFERRAFNSEMTAMVYWALAWYSSGLIFHCVVEVISRAFYAVHDTKTPVLVLLIAMLLNMGLSILLSRLFRSLGWMPHGGLALANTIATGLEMTTLLTLMRRKLHGLEGKRILQALMQSAVSATLMVIVLEVWIRFSVGSSDLIIVIVGVILGVSVYAGMCFIFKVEELSSIRKLIHI